MTVERESGGRTLRSGRARLYQTLRTAHLEQALELAPATILYRDRRYDFDERLAVKLDLVQVGPLRAAVLLARSPVDEFEINEPLMRYTIRGSALALLGLRLRERFGGSRATVVTYAIENHDPFALPGGSVRARCRAAIDLALTRFVWRQVDRIVYGTEASRELYGRVLPAPHPDMAENMIPTLPQACTCQAEERDPERVVFLGAFSDRKGFPLVMQAWPLVRDELGSASLVVMGKGAQEQQARLWAAGDDSVELIVDPDRAEIHRQLRRAQVLTLPSQPSATWTEQLGLPITEALAHGCSIVSTRGTGLAKWLRDHGHTLIEPGGSPAGLAEAVVTAVRARRSPQEVVAALPARDGRLLADDWMFDTRAVS